MRRRGPPRAPARRGGRRAGIRRAPRGRKAPAGAPAWRREDLASLVRREPRLLSVLQRHGVVICAGCWLTLSSTPERAAAYHGVPDIEGFLADLGRRLSRPR